MNKLFALILVLAMVFTLCACGADKEDYDKDKPAVTTKGQQIKLPKGWGENNYGAYIYDVWDADFLPECFPAPMDGVKVEQTTFKDYDHDTLSGSYAVGPLFYDSYEDYREYGLSFYANSGELEAFIAAVEAKGLQGGLTEEGTWTFYNYFGNGWFMEIFVREALGQDDYQYIVNVNATDSLFALPKTVSGIPLPQCGVTDYDYNKYYTIQDFAEGYEDVEFDLAKDKLPKQYYAAWFNYYGTVNQDAIDYAQQLKDLGWEVEWESQSEDGYRCCLKKDGVYAVSNYYAYDCMMEVGFSDMVENLSY